MIGIAAGVVCYWGVTGLKHMFGYDDALDAFGVHGVGGIVGALLTGVFAVEQYGGTAGLIEGNPGQVLNQIIGVGIVFVYDAVVTLIILKLIDVVIGLRVTRGSRARRSRSRAARRDRTMAERRAGDPAASPLSRGPVTRRGLLRHPLALRSNSISNVARWRGNPVRSSAALTRRSRGRRT